MAGSKSQPTNSQGRPLIFNGSCFCSNTYFERGLTKVTVTWLLDPEADSPAPSRLSFYSIAPPPSACFASTTTKLKDP
jgi:hypothetical protein